MSAPAASPARAVPAPARSPRAALVLTSWAFVLAIVLLAVAVIAGQAAYVAARGQGTSWFASLADGLDGLQPETWVGVVGVIVALVGLWLLWQAVRPRPRTTLRVVATSGVHLRSADVARWVNATARDVPGVLDARTSVTRRSVRVTVRTTGSSDILSDVRDEVARQLSALERPPSLTVRPGEGRRS
jgi:hypothetical protein